MTGRAHVFVWLCILLAALFASPLLYSPASISHRVAEDIRSIDHVLGRENAAMIVSRANTMYRAIFFDGGVSNSSSQVYNSKNSIDESRSFVGVAAMANMTNHYLESLAINCYSFALRVLTFFVWVPLFLPFMLASAVDGSVVRSIKLDTFRYNAPLSYSLGLHATIFGIFLPIFYLIMPFPVSPWLIPIWALAISMALMLMIRNVQRIRSGI